MTSGDEVQLVVFRVGSQMFALNIFQVERVLRYQEATPLPGAPSFLEGVFPYGERSVPLVDLRKRFGEPARVRDDTRVIILSDDDGGVGIVVDAVLAVRKVGAEEVQSPSRMLTGLAAECVQATIVADDRTIVLLAAGRLLTTTEQIALRDLQAEATG
ncbi:MAG: chemotaxis protein CheW [Gemmatimonadota bacterium]|nr:chemotaxis protein CheW [Gemmatimonadota bacterium]